MGLLGIGQSNLTTPIESMDILPRHSGASRNLMLVPPLSSALAAEYAAEIGTETAPSICGIPPTGICPHGLASVAGYSTHPGGRPQGNPNSAKTPASISSLTNAAPRNGPFQIAATGLRSRMFLSQHHGPVAGVTPVQCRRLGRPPRRV